MMSGTGRPDRPPRSNEITLYEGLEYFDVLTGITWRWWAGAWARIGFPDEKPPIDIDQACEVMHDAYEEAAVKAGWETNPRSRVPWADVPEANKETMRASVGALLSWLGHA